MLDTATYTPRLLAVYRDEIRGKLRADEGRIELGGGGVPTLPDDVVIVGDVKGAGPAGAQARGEKLRIGADVSVDLGKNLRMTASHIVDPGVRAVFDRMAEETETHYAIIESEYAHMMGMVHETDIDTYVRE